MKKIDKFTKDLYLGIFPESPFTDKYTRREIKFYGLTHYDKDGIKIIFSKMNGPVDEYFNKNWWIGQFAVPIFYIDKKQWMSITPMEIQSAAVAIATACGDCATSGLGMGYYALRVVENEDVASLDVYETNERVIKFFQEQFHTRKGYEKIRFIHGDARELMKGKIYDHVFMDIYKSMLGDEVIADHKHFTEKNSISEYIFWGQEKVVLQGLVNEWHPHMSYPEKALFYWWLKNDTKRNMYDNLLEYNEEFCRNALIQMGRIDE